MLIKRTPQLTLIVDPLKNYNLGDDGGGGKMRVNSEINSTMIIEPLHTYTLVFKSREFAIEHNLPPHLHPKFVFIEW